MSITDTIHQWSVRFSGVVWVMDLPPDTQASLKVLKNGASVLSTTDLAAGRNSFNNVQLVPLRTWSSGDTVNLLVSGATNTLFNITHYNIDGIFVTAHFMLWSN